MAAQHEFPPQPLATRWSRARQSISAKYAGTILLSVHTLVKRLREYPSSLKLYDTLQTVHDI
jgi:hypothetical protein